MWCFVQVFKDYDVPPEVETMTNNGHSVTFTIEPAEHMDYPKVFAIRKLNQTTCYSQPRL